LQPSGLRLSFSSFANTFAPASLMNENNPIVKNKN
jgi:hypothetical protein